MADVQLRTAIQDYAHKINVMEKTLKSAKAELKESHSSNPTKQILTSQTPDRMIVSQKNSPFSTKPFNQSVHNQNSAVSQEIMEQHDVSRQESQYSISDSSEVKRLVKERIKIEKPKWEIALQTNLQSELKSKYAQYEKTLLDLDIQKNSVLEEYTRLKREESDCQQILQKAEEMKALLSSKSENLRNLDNELADLAMREARMPIQLTASGVQNQAEETKRQVKLLRSSMADLQKEIQLAYHEMPAHKEKDDRLAEPNDFIEEEEKVIQGLRSKLTSLGKELQSSRDERSLREELHREQEMLQSLAVEIQQAEKDRAILYGQLEEVRRNGLSNLPSSRSVKSNLQPRLSELWRDKFQRENQELVRDSKEFEVRINNLQVLEQSLQDYHSRFNQTINPAPSFEAYDDYLLFLTEVYTDFLSSLVEEEREEAAIFYNRISDRDRDVEKYKSQYMAIKAKELRDYKANKITNYSPPRKYSPLQENSELHLPSNT